MESQGFSTRIRLRYRDADPEGILFFGRPYAIAHDVYEEFVSFLGCDWRSWFQNPEWAVPIRSSSCDHLRPMRAGSECEVKVAVEKIGESSFTLRYEFNCEGTSSAVVRLVHTFVDKKKFAKRPIPSEIRDRLQACLS